MINPILQGWYGYFKFSHWTTFTPVDSWLRMRLRSILRKRQRKRGRGRGSDHQLWPNVYVRSHKLFSLVKAHRDFSQSVRR